MCFPTYRKGPKGIAEAKTSLVLGQLICQKLLVTDAFEIFTQERARVKYAWCAWASEP